MTQLENCYRIDSDLAGGHTLYVYPVTQIHVDGHPEVAQFLAAERWGDGQLMLRIKHPLGETYLKVNGQVLLKGLIDFLEDDSTRE